MLFKDIIGHQDTKAQLINTVAENRVSHAQLFLGSEGSGSLALAIAYAQYINCENKQIDDSCGACASCRKYNKLVHPDLHFSYPFFAKDKNDTAVNYIEQWRSAVLKRPYMGLDYWRNQFSADNKQANINIAEAHRIIKTLSLKAFESAYKILIIWLPEYLDVQGNALLKLIEEPPAKTLFILVCENQDKILSTIISRTQLVKIKHLSDVEIQHYLEENVNVPADKAAEIAFISGGSVQQAFDLLEEAEHNHFDRLVRWLRYCVTDNGMSIVDICEQELSQLGRENQKSFLLYAVNMMRQLLLTQLGMHQMVQLRGDEKDFADKFSKHYQVSQLQETIRLFEEAHFHIERNANPKILFLDLSLQLVLIYKYATIREIANTI